MKASFPAGVDNRHPDYDMPDGTLRNAVNIDIDNQGNLRRRDGYVKSKSGINTHSGWSCALWTLIVTAGRLQIWNDDDSYTDLMPVQGPVCYHLLDNIVYFSDGVGSYKLLSDGSVVNWGVAVPSEPSLSITSGSLAAGTYLAAVAPVSYDGFVHGSSEIVSIEVDANSGIVFALPVVSDPQVECLRVFLSTTDGEELFAIADTALTSYTVTSSTGDGVVLETHGCAQMPAGTTIDSYRGRVYVKAGELIWYSDPMAYDRTRPSDNYLLFNQDVDMFAADENGLWIAANKTYFYAGTDPGNFSVTTVLDYGAVPGQAKTVPNTNELVWYSTRGLVKASNGIANLQEAHVAAETGAAVSVMIREFNGSRQAIASVTNSEVSPLAAKSFLDMEVVRKAG